MMALTIDHDLTEPRRCFRIQLTAASDTIDNSLPFITPSSIFQDFITHLLCFINSPGFLPTFWDTRFQSLVLARCSLPRLSLLDFLKSVLSHLLVPGCNYYPYAITLPISVRNDFAVINKKNSRQELQIFLLITPR